MAVSPHPEPNALYWCTPSGPAGLEELLAWRAGLRSDGKKLVAAAGSFDLFQIGHVRYLQAARSMGDALVVGLYNDSSVASLEGLGRPLIPEADRAALLAALRCVDQVVVLSRTALDEFHRVLQPDIQAKAEEAAGDSLISARLLASSQVLQMTACQLNDNIQKAADLMITALKAGNKILACGNGGSAADAQHFAAELVVRFLHNRVALPAIALTTDTSILTATANDTGFENVFSRQVQALGQPGDVLVAISTSGNSPNVLAAAQAARFRGMKVIGLMGATTCRLVDLTDLPLQVPSIFTPSIQQAHTAVLHVLCELVEKAFLPG